MPLDTAGSAALVFAMSDNAAMNLRLVFCCSRWCDFRRLFFLQRLRRCGAHPQGVRISAPALRRRADSRSYQRPLSAFLAFFSARFSSGVLEGFFLPSFLRSIPLLIRFAPVQSVTPNPGTACLCAAACLHFSSFWRARAAFSAVDSSVVAAMKSPCSKALKDSPINIHDSPVDRWHRRSMQHPACILQRPTKREVSTTASSLQAQNEAKPHGRANLRSHSPPAAQVPAKT